MKHKDKDLQKGARERKKGEEEEKEGAEEKKEKGGFILGIWGIYDQEF
jgi:hypothetical protein